MPFKMHKIIIFFRKIKENVCLPYLKFSDGLPETHQFFFIWPNLLFEPVHEISNVVCATSKASDQPAHTHSLIMAFASRLSNL